MCGIVGYLNLDGSPLDPEGKPLSNMCASIIHRGPDEEGKLIVGPVALGMRRLSIIDLASGQQPISNEDDSVVIVFNGEIYNYQELQARLRASGHHLKTNSDTETIVHLYEDYGVECVQHLEGMFAFAIWDKKLSRLFIARDRMGEKPLYWHQSGNQFVFSSELKGILNHPSAQRNLNLYAFRQYLALEYVPAPQSILEGINKLPPAHYLLVDANGVKVDRYWSLPEARDTISDISEREAKAKLEELLTESIRLRLISEVPLGIFLSGGIDSSIITAIASRLVSHKLQTFSVGFSDPSFDESSHAETVAKHLGCDHHVIPFEPHIALESMRELFNFLDEPMGDASLIPTFLLSRTTRKSVTVALSGEGGDELLGGYPTYLAHRLADVWNLVPATLRKSVVEPLAQQLPVSLDNLSFDYKLKRFLSSSDQPAVRRQLRWMGSFPVSQQAGLLTQDVLEATGTIDGEESLVSHLDEREIGWSRKSYDVADTIMRLDIRTYLADNMLVKSDRTTMATSLEARLPFLAYPLVEFAVSLPPHLKYRGRTSKYLLRKLASEYLPDDIIKRPKKGFGIPTGKWLRKELKPMVNQLLGEEFIASQGLFRWQAIRLLIEEHDSGKVDRRKELWTLLAFQSWWDRCLGGSHKSYLSHSSHCDKAQHLDNRRNTQALASRTSGSHS